MKVLIDSSAAQTVTNIMNNFRPKATRAQMEALTSVLNDAAGTPYDTLHSLLGTLCGFIRAQAKSEHQLGLAFTLAAMLVFQFEGEVEIEEPKAPGEEIAQAPRSLN